MHVQNRDFAQFQKTSNKLLVTKGDSKAHWMGFVVACFLNEDYDRCLKTIDVFVSTIAKKDLYSDPFEKSELQFFKVLVIEKASGVADALKSLQEQKSIITDKEEWTQKCAEYEGILGLKQQEIEHWKELVDGNAENFNFHLGLLHALEIIPKSHCKLLTNLTQ